jgi:predicted alpha/beta hydrolase family esterase
MGSGFLGLPDVFENSVMRPWFLNSRLPRVRSEPTWPRFFEQQAGPLSRNTVLVGHSLGVTSILHLPARIEDPIAGAFLVVGFLGSLKLLDYDKINREFVLPVVDRK